LFDLEQISVQVGGRSTDVAPVSPGLPWGPTGPGWPDGPVWPWGPGAPGSPLRPIGPVTPGSPGEPLSPAGPLIWRSNSGCRSSSAASTLTSFGSSTMRRAISLGSMAVATVLPTCASTHCQVAIDVPAMAMTNRSALNPSWSAIHLRIDDHPFGFGRESMSCSFIGRDTEAWFVTPNGRAKRATTAGRQARAGENVPRTARPGLVACRWRSA